MVTRKMVIRKSWDFAKVLKVDVAKHASDLQCVRRVPDIINNSTISWRIVGEAQLVRAAISRLEFERMSHAVACEIPVAMVYQIRMIARDPPLRDEIVHARPDGGVEVAANQERYLCAVRILLRRSRLLGCGVSIREIRFCVKLSMLKGCLVCASRMLCPAVGQPGNLLQHDRYLDQFDVLECRVPVNVHIDDNESRSSGPILKESDNRDVIPGHDPVKCVVLTLHVRSIDGGIGKVNNMFVE